MESAKYRYYKDGNNRKRRRYMDLRTMCGEKIDWRPYAGYCRNVMRAVIADIDAGRWDYSDDWTMQLPNGITVIAVIEWYEFQPKPRAYAWRIG